jgi:branched-chain amino acid aminotransferase
VVECSASNLFWFEADAVRTAPVFSGILPGVTRAVVIELCPSLGLPLREEEISLEKMRQASGVFLTNSAYGLIEVAALDGRPLPTSPWFDTLARGYQRALLTETAPGAASPPARV